MAVSTNIPAELKKYKMVYWAMAVIQMVAGTVVYVLVSTGSLGPPDYTAALFYQKVALIMIPFMMAAGYFSFRYVLSRLDQKQPLDARLKKYFSFILIRSAFFEIAFFYCCICAILSKVLLFLWIAPVVFFVFLLLRPTQEGITTDLQLSQADSKKLTKA